MEFKSQICTSRVQSERLIALGLKKETADMSHRYSNIDGNYEESVFPYSSILALKERMNKPILGRGWEELYGRDIPAWSLHRLIEITSDFCDVDGEEGVWCCECRDLLGYRSVMTESWLIMWNKPSLYDNIIDCIEWLIKEGYFNEEYLEEKK